VCDLQPVFIQSFETRNLQQIRPLTNLPIVQLLSGATVTFNSMSA
jgi:glycerophosphoryl diester phosphodiesterase